MKFLLVCFQKGTTACGKISPFNQNYVFIISVSHIDRSKAWSSSAVLYLRKCYKKSCYAILGVLGISIFRDILKAHNRKALDVINAHTFKHIPDNAREVAEFRTFHEPSEVRMERTQQASSSRWAASAEVIPAIA